MICKGSNGFNVETWHCGDEQNMPDFGNLFHFSFSNRRWIWGTSRFIVIDLPESLTKIVRRCYRMSTEVIFMS